MILRRIALLSLQQRGVGKGGGGAPAKKEIERDDDEVVTAIQCMQPFSHNKIITEIV